jgi:hypothetical protein
LFVTFSASATAAGSIYCAAFTFGDVPASASSILINGFSSSVSAGTISVLVNIKSLNSLMTYNGYCAFEAIDRTTSTIAQILSKNRTFTTLCCKDISYQTVPTYVHNNKFVFMLSSLPSSSVSIIPTLLRYNGTAVSRGLYTLSPSTIYFSSKSTSLTSSFNLLVGTSLSGFFNLSLVLNGANVNQYTAPVVRVQIIQYTANQIPAPKLSSVNIF